MELHSEPQLVPQLEPLLVTHLEPASELAMARMKELHSAPQLEPHSAHASVRESARTTAPRWDCTYNLIPLEPGSELKSEASEPS